MLYFLQKPGPTPTNFASPVFFAVELSRDKATTLAPRPVEGPSRRHAGPRTPSAWSTISSRSPPPRRGPLRNC